MDLKYLITLENKKNLIYFFKFYEFYFAYLTALGLGVCVADGAVNWFDAQLKT